MSWLARAFRRAPKQTRNDGWANVITGLLSSRDKRTGGYSTVDLVTDIQARDMWRGDDIAKRVIEVLPKEAMRRGYDIKVTDADGETDKELAEEIDAAGEELGVDQAVVKAMMYERAYGGAAIFPVMDGALGDLATPLTTAGISKVRALHVLEPRELYPTAWYTDITSPKFGRPSMYRCIPLFAGGVMSAPMLQIHESRLVIFHGIKVTRLPQPGTLLGWGDNILTAMFQVLSDFGQSWGTVASLLQDFSQAVLQIEGLDNLSDNERGKTAKRRIEQIDMVRHAMRMIVIDSRDKFSREQTPLTNLSDIMDRMATRLAAAADMPVTLLMGMSPAGLNATGESDRAFFYDRVSALQHYVTPMVEQLLRFIMLSIEGPTMGIEPEVWSIEWKPLWAPSEKEIAETRYTNAQADNLYVMNLTLTPEEVRARWKGDTYGDIALNQDAFDAQNAVDVDVSDLTPEDEQALGAKPTDTATGEEPNTTAAVPPRTRDTNAVRTKKQADKAPRMGRRVPVVAHERTLR